MTIKDDGRSRLTTWRDQEREIGCTFYTSDISASSFLAAVTRNVKSLHSFHIKITMLPCPGWENSYPQFFRLQQVDGVTTALAQEWLHPGFGKNKAGEMHARSPTCFCSAVAVTM